MDRKKLWDRMVNASHALAKFNHGIEVQAKDGFGEPMLAVHKDEWALAQLIYGPQCWFDPDFKKAYARDNPHVRVRASRGTRGQEYAGTRTLTKPLPKGTLFVPPHIAAERQQNANN